jgi:hypothetical protein
MLPAGVLGLEDVEDAEQAPIPSRAVTVSATVTAQPVRPL